MILVAVLEARRLVLRGSGFPWKGMFVSGLKIHYSASWEPLKGFKLYAAAHVLMAINASVVLGMGFMFSCFNMKPAAATILALSFLFASFVMEHIRFWRSTGNGF